MGWYYYALLAAILYPIVAIIAGNIYWYMFNRHMTVVGCWCGKQIITSTDIFCQKKPSLFFQLLFYTLHESDSRFEAGKECIRYNGNYYLETILDHNPEMGFNKGTYVAQHLILLPFKLIKLFYAIVIHLGLAIIMGVIATIIFLVNCISWLSGSKSQSAKIHTRVKMINEGRIEEVIAKANPKKFRAPEQASASAPAERLKEIAVKAANLEAERLELEEQLQAEEDAQASGAGARVYQLKPSNGD